MFISLDIVGGDEIREVCMKFYKFFEGVFKKNVIKIVDCFKDKCFIFVGDEFLFLK